MAIVDKMVGKVVVSSWSSGFVQLTRWQGSCLGSCVLMTRWMCISDQVVDQVVSRWPGDKVVDQMDVQLVDQITVSSWQGGWPGDCVQLIRWLCPGGFVQMMDPIGWPGDCVQLTRWLTRWCCPAAVPGVWEELRHPHPIWSKNIIEKTFLWYLGILIKYKFSCFAQMRQLHIIWSKNSINLSSFDLKIKPNVFSFHFDLKITFKHLVILGDFLRYLGKHLSPWCYLCEHLSPYWYLCEHSNKRWSMDGWLWGIDGCRQGCGVTFLKKHYSHIRLHFVTVCTFSYRIDQATSPSTGCSALCVWCCAGYWTQ